MIVKNLVQDLVQPLVQGIMGEEAGVTYYNGLLFVPAPANSVNDLSNCESDSSVITTFDTDHTICEMNTASAYLYLQQNQTGIEWDNLLNYVGQTVGATVRIAVDIKGIGSAIGKDVVISNNDAQNLGTVTLTGEYQRLTAEAVHAFGEGYGPWIGFGYNNGTVTTGEICHIKNVEFGVICEAPAAPSGLMAGAASDSIINLSWTDNSDNEVWFKVERSPNGTDSWTELTPAGVDATLYQNSGLDPETTYYYRVSAVNPAGESATTSVANATTEALSPPVLETYAFNNTGAATVNSVTVTLPSGIQAGDLLVTWAGCYYSTDGSSTDWSTPTSGWTRLGKAGDNNADWYQGTFYKIAAGGETTMQINWTGSARRLHAGAIRVSGVDQSTPFNNSLQWDSPSNPLTTETVTGLSYTNPASLAVIVGSCGSSAVDPTGITVTDNAWAKVADDVTGDYGLAFLIKQATIESSPVGSCQINRTGASLGTCASVLIIQAG